MTINEIDFRRHYLRISEDAAFNVNDTKEFEISKVYLNFNVNPESIECEINLMHKLCYPTA